jgi:spore coat protein CotH
VSAALSIYLIAVPTLAGQSPTPTFRTNDGDRIFALTALHRLRVSLSAAEWAVLQTSTPRNATGRGGTDYTLADGRLVHAGSGFGGYFPWVHADIQVDGLEFKDAGLRYKGNLSFTASSTAAPLRANFKLKIDTYGTKGTWDGEKTFNFQAGIVDSSRMREALAFAIFRAAGVPAPRTAYAELIFNVPGLFQDTSAGLFTLVEDVNKKFLARALPPGTGLVMKPEGLRGGIQNLGATWAQFEPILRPEREATPHEQQRVMEFARLISQTDVALFRSQIGEYLDVDAFLRFIAVNAALQNWDSYIGGTHNFYLYLDPVDDKFRFIPWDVDLSMGQGPAAGAVGPGSMIDVLTPQMGSQPLIYWLLDDPAVMARYRTIVRELATKVFTPDLLSMADEIARIGTGRGPSPRAYLEGRIAYLQKLIAGWDRP